MSTKSPTIVAVDLSEIDNRIVMLESSQKEIQANLLAVDTELVELRMIRKYLTSDLASTKGKIEVIKGLKGGTYTDGISKYILTYLQRGGADTAEIKAAYALEIGKSVDDVSNNVSNALSRLKDKGKIIGIPQGNGTKAGNVWYLKT